MIGAGVVKTEAKLISLSFGGMTSCVLSEFPFSESVEETERRFVRAGVRNGGKGGADRDPEEVVRCLRKGRLESSCSSSATVSGKGRIGLVLWASKDFRMVVSLRLRCIVEGFARSGISKGSSDDGSGVVGAEVKTSEGDRASEVVEAEERAESIDSGGGTSAETGTSGESSSCLVVNHE